jgi:hypothetical protein
VFVGTGVSVCVGVRVGARRGCRRHGRVERSGAHQNSAGRWRGCGPRSAP